MNIEEKIQKNILLAPLTTYKIGGPAEYFCEVNNEEELSAIFSWIKKKNTPFVVLAGGSNVLISDKGVKGIVIKLNNREIKLKGERIESGAGVDLGRAVRMAGSGSLVGFEWAAGVPGSVGGAIRGNAGCFGSDIAEILEIVKAYDINADRFKLYSRHDCRFSYRGSVFKNNRNLIIWQATFRLRPGNSIKIANAMADIIKKRNNAFPKLPSAGSVFKNLNINYIKKNNPVLAKKFIVENLVRGDMVGAKQVIADLGLAGKIIGQAKISLEHPNFIVNTGRATAEDVVMLISLIKMRARNELKLQLNEEIQYLGF